MGEKSFFAEIHRELDAKMVPAGKYDLPLSYPGGTLAEHRHSCTGASIFDRSGVRRFQLAGKGTAGVLDGIFLRPVADMEIGKVRNNALLYENGTVAAVFTLCRMQEDDFMLMLWENVPEKAVKHLQKLSGTSTVINELSGAMAGLTLIGPECGNVLRGAGADKLPENGSWMMNCLRDEDGDELRCIVIHSDRFGQESYDICCNASYALEVYGAVYRIPPLAPAGNMAWESLRIERMVPAFGSEIGESVFPQECGLEKWVDLSRKFCGSDVLQKTADFLHTVAVTLERLPALPGSPVMTEDGDVAGVVTCGAFCPVAGTAQVMCRIRSDVQINAGMTLVCQVSGKNVAGKVAGFAEL